MPHTQLQITRHQELTMRVLIVDDDPEQCLSMCRLLKRRGIATTCAETLGEAEALMAAGTPEIHCAVVDGGLPDSSAIETARALRRIFGETPVVFLTGSDDRDVIREATSHGAFYCLKGGSGETETATDVMRLVLLAIEHRSPAREVEDAIVAEHRERPPLEKPKPWFLQWVPLMSFSLALLVASATAGGIIVHSIAEKASEQQSTNAKFHAIEEFITGTQRTIERLASDSRELQAKAQASIDDRANIHKDLGSIEAQQRLAVDQMTRRLERIEDTQLQIIKMLQNGGSGGKRSE